MSLEQVAAIEAARAADPGPRDPLERRAWFEARLGAIPVPAGVLQTPVRITGNLGGLLTTAPGARTDRVLLWLHGGAFFLGSSNSYRDFAARASAAAGVSVLVPDYRLVPEHPFPAAHEDTLAALDWLEGEGHAPAHIVIGGDSAGGNLAAGAVQARLASGGPVPAGVWLLSPYLDLTHSGASILSRTALDRFIDPAGMAFVAARYLNGTAPTDPRGSPLFGAVDGFPPTLIQVGSDEVLFDDSARFADELRAAGIEVAFQEWIGMMHVWPAFAWQLDEGQWAHSQAGLWLRRLFAR